MKHKCSFKALVSLVDDEEVIAIVEYEYIPGTRGSWLEPPDPPVAEIGKIFDERGLEIPEERLAAGELDRLSDRAAEHGPDAVMDAQYDYGRTA